jgi:hypothetical protein
MVESQPSKLLVAGSIPVSRSRFQQLAATELSTVTPFTPLRDHTDVYHLWVSGEIYAGWGHLQKTATLGPDCESD